MVDVKSDSITIMLKLVGTACNMKCLYCYEHIASQTIINVCKNINSIKSYLARFINYRHIFIVFHGGEPLLSDIKIVEELLYYIFSIFKYKCNVQIQTNGTLLDEKWIELFSKFKEKVSLSISLDPHGDKELRILPGTDYRKIVLENIIYALNYIPNVGIISVANKFNYEYFETFIKELMLIGVKSLTINKCQGCDTDYSLSELEYVELLKRISILWIKNGWYQKINIQPLSSLFSNKKNRLCIYLPDKDKCSQFRTYYGNGIEQEYCDHITNKSELNKFNECQDCNIYYKCGGGCILERRNKSFCDARKDLFRFIERVKYGNKRS